MTRKKPKAPICMHCEGVEADLVTGAVIYPRRGDLRDNWFWRCPDCGAYVGCHQKTQRAKGRPANAELRDARIKLHNMRVDPIWRNAVEFYETPPADGLARKILLNTARVRVYAFLAERLGIDKKDCHIAMFSLEQCRAAWSALFQVNYGGVRAWHKAREAERARAAAEIEAVDSVNETAARRGAVHCEGA